MKIHFKLVIQKINVSIVTYLRASRAVCVFFLSCFFISLHFALDLVGGLLLLLLYYCPAQRYVLMPQNVLFKTKMTQNILSYTEGRQKRSPNRQLNNKKKRSCFSLAWNCLKSVFGPARSMIRVTQVEISDAGARALVCSEGKKTLKLHQLTQSAAIITFNWVFTCASQCKYMYKTVFSLLDFDVDLEFSLYTWIIFLITHIAMCGLAIRIFPLQRARAHVIAHSHHNLLSNMHVWPLSLRNIFMPNPIQLILIGFFSSHFFPLFMCSPLCFKRNLKVKCAMRSRWKGV